MKIYLAHVLGSRRKQKISRLVCRVLGHRLFRDDPRHGMSMKYKICRRCGKVLI